MPHVGDPIKAFWWSGRPNFGDELTALILDHFEDVQVQQSKADVADVAMVGSVIHTLTENHFHGIAAGVGKLFGDRPANLPGARVLGVRGPLTARDFPGRDLALGDPGLLVSDIVRDVPKRYKLGIVPHWSDLTLEKRYEFKSESLKIDPSERIVIRPDADPVVVIGQIAACRKIVASSLHGIITADAYGIPRRFEMTPRFEREGYDFKVRDHNASIGVPHEIGVTQEAPHWRVQARQMELFDLVHEVGRLLTGRKY